QGVDAPRDVPPRGPPAWSRAGPPRQARARHHALAFAHQRLLVDAGVLIGAPEFDERINVGADLARKLPAVAVSLHAHDDALAVHTVDHAVPLRQHHRARIAGGDLLD